MSSTTFSWTLPRAGAVLLAVVSVIALAIITPKLVEILDANRIMVIQTMGGDLECYTEPGPKFQALGHVTTYPRRGTVEFNDRPQVDPNGVIKDAGTGKPLQFNDGGKGTLYGSVNWEMPLDCKQIVEIHRDFGSEEGINSKAVARMVNSAIYLSGPMMSSTESAAEKRGTLVELINDQAQFGVYQTQTRTVDDTDAPIVLDDKGKVVTTAEKRTKNVVEIVRNPNGTPKRQQGSILEQYGIRLQPMSFEDIAYSAEVEDQLKARQNAIQQVRLSQENARRAQQDAVTAEENGKATAAKARWEQETIKAKEVTLAGQKLEVATLAAREAEQFKREQILRGEGEAERRRLVLAADGALDAKLATYKEVMGMWSTAFGNFKGQLVPQVTMGSSSGGNGMTGTQGLIEMLSAKTARDLALDLSNTGSAATAKK